MRRSGSAPYLGVIASLVAISLLFHWLTFLAISFTVIWLSFTIWAAVISFKHLRHAHAMKAWNRTRAGLCVNCAYDLRATPDRCPECGTIPPKSKLISN
jgi:hypothetical protein